MVGMKRRRQRKRKSAHKINNSVRSSRIITKNLEIFVTDFLIDPCGLPLELKDCVLVDGAISMNENSDIYSSNSSQILKKIFTNSLIVEDSCQKTNECEQLINI